MRRDPNQPEHSRRANGFDTPTPNSHRLWTGGRLSLRNGSVSLTAANRPGNHQKVWGMGSFIS